MMLKTAKLTVLKLKKTKLEKDKSVLLGVLIAWGMSLFSASILAMPSLSPISQKLVAELELSFVLNPLSVEHKARHTIKLPLSKARKVNGRWGHKQLIDAKFSQEQLSFELDQALVLDKVWQSLASSVVSGPVFESAPAAKLLFSCQGLACGSSNQWANGVFDRPFLYGPDRQQYYAVYRLDEQRYLQAYLIRRGNQRIYLHIVLLQAEPFTASDMQLDSLQGSFLWRAVDAKALTNKQAKKLDVDWLEALKDLLKQYPAMQVSLVGHAYGQDALKHSAALAQILQQGLSQAGVDAKRLNAIGLGDKSPNAVFDPYALEHQGLGDERVELILHFPMAK